MFGRFSDLFAAQVEDAQDEAKKKEGKLQFSDSESEAIRFDLNDLNFEHLQRKRAFFKGVNIVLGKKEDGETSALADFKNLPDIMPVKAKGKDYGDLSYDDLMRPISTSYEEVKEDNITDRQENCGEESGQACPRHLFNYDKASSADKHELMSRFELIRFKKVEYSEGDKTVAVILNPTCEGGAGLEETLSSRLRAARVPHIIHVTAEPLDAFRIANSKLNLAQHCILAVAGGDGTVSEAVNGMLARADGLRIPIAVIPTGQNNDIAVSLGINSLDAAVANLRTPEAITVDTTRVLLDCEDERGLPSDESRLQSVRYMLSGSSLAMPAKISSGAAGMKGCCGKSSYSLASFFQALTCGFVADTFDLEIDGVRMSREGTPLLCVSNSKNSSGGAIMNPFAVLNDGLIDITWVRDPAWHGTFGVTGVLSDARSGGGIQAYKGHSSYMRGRKIKAHFQDPESPEDAEPELSTETGEATGAAGTLAESQGIQQYITIDGDDLQYSSSITWECLPSHIEVLVNTSDYFLDAESFSKLIDEKAKLNRLVDGMVDKIWDEYDTDKNGRLDQDETRKFVQAVLKDTEKGGFDESEFQSLFGQFDVSRDGVIEKPEMSFFIKQLMKRKQ